VDYTITQKFDREGISEKKVYTNAYTNEDIINLNVKKDANGNIITPNVTTVHRVQLAYSEVDEDGTFKITDASGNVATVTKNDDGTANVSVVDSQGNAIASLDDGSGNPVNITFTSDDNYVPGDDEIAINTQLGEVLLGENVYNNTYTNNSFSVQYDKSNFKKGDVNPTMYFDCVDNVTGIVYQKKDEDIEYNVNFTQKLKVNTQASESFNIYLGRNVDDIMAAVQNTIDIENQIKKVESMKNEERYSSTEDQKALDDILEGLNKQNDLAKDQMTKAFEKGIGQMQGYQEQISNAKADVGNRIHRLDLTKSRLTEQKTNFTSLKSENEDIDLEEVVVNYTAAQLVYNAALSAASKVVQQTLLDFIG
jgi:flagellar hook-associated protein 3 FlgL